MTMKEKSVGLVHNIPSPYRLPVFEELSNECELIVYFATTSHEDRYWNPELDEYTFNKVFLNSKKIGLLYISFSLIYHLLRERHEYLIISENPPTVVLTAISIIFGKITGAEIIIWNEAWNEDIMSTVTHLSLKKKLYELLISSVVRLYRKAVYSCSDRFVSFSKMATDYLIHMGVSPTDIVTSHQVMPAEQLPEPLNSDITGDFNQNKVSFLYVGYIRPGKGVECLLHAFNEVKSNNSNCELIIVGEGENGYVNNVRKMGEKIDDVKFLGYLEDKKADCYSMADVVVLPTYRDAWGLVINEALYYGTPVVTTEAAAGKEILDRNGMIVPSGDEFALANAMNHCMSPDILELITPEKEHDKFVSDPRLMSEVLIESCDSGV